MPQLINWELARNPLNWIIMFLMVAIAYMGAGLIAANASLPK
jgi:hypothetical protein